MHASVYLVMSGSEILPCGVQRPLPQAAAYAPTVPTHLLLSHKAWRRPTRVGPELRSDALPRTRLLVGVENAAHVSAQLDEPVFERRQQVARAAVESPRTARLRRKARRRAIVCRRRALLREDAVGVAEGDGRVAGREWVRDASRR